MSQSLNIIFTIKAKPQARFSDFDNACFGTNYTVPCLILCFCSDTIGYLGKSVIAKYIKFNHFSWQCSAFSSGLLLNENSLKCPDLRHFI